MTKVMPLPLWHTLKQILKRPQFVADECKHKHSSSSTFIIVYIAVTVYCKNTHRLFNWLNFIPGNCTWLRATIPILFLWICGCGMPVLLPVIAFKTLQWRHDRLNGVSTHQPYDCLLNCLFGSRSKKTSKAPRHWPLCRDFTGDRWIPRTKG